MAGGAPKTLSDAQIREIIRLKQTKKTTKQIAKLVGCSPDQVTHYWRSSVFYRSAGRREARRRRAQIAKMNAASLAKRQAREQADAKAELAQQLRLAREEAPHTQPFKGGF